MRSHFLFRKWVILFRSYFSWRFSLNHLRYLSLLISVVAAKSVFLGQVSRVAWGPLLAFLNERSDVGYRLQNEVHGLLLHNCLLELPNSVSLEQVGDIVYLLFEIVKLPLGVAQGVHYFSYIHLGFLSHVAKLSSDILVILVVCLIDIRRRRE